MSVDWFKYNFETVITNDGSPTLRWLGDENQETMHHSGGAYIETQLIYGEPVRQGIKQGARSALSVGLGLGYNEILIATEAMAAQILPAQFRMVSFESEVILRTELLKWIQSRSDAAPIYDDVFSFYELERSAKIKEVKSWLLEMFESGAWKILESLNSDTEIEEKFEMVLYDAFSSKTSPYLWQEDFLNRFLVQVAADRCLLTTYACTGNLKRALKANGFSLYLPAGFHSKRNRTIAFKGFEFKNGDN